MSKIQQIQDVEKYVRSINLAVAKIFKCEPACFKYNDEDFVAMPITDGNSFLVLIKSKYTTLYAYIEDAVVFNVGVKRKGVKLEPIFCGNSKEDAKRIMKYLNRKNSTRSSDKRAFGSNTNFLMTLLDEDLKAARAENEKQKNQEYEDHMSIEYINTSLMYNSKKGDSYLYIYTFPSFLELYSSGVRSTITVKIGRTSYDKSPAKRIYEQIRKSGITSMPERPIILAYSVYDSGRVDLEKKLHALLKTSNIKKGKLTGTEWFAVAPNDFAKALADSGSISEPSSFITYKAELKKFASKVSEFKGINNMISYYKSFISHGWIYCFKYGCADYLQYHWSDEQFNEINDEIYDYCGLEGDLNVFKQLSYFYSEMACFLYDTYYPELLKAEKI